MLNSIRFYLNLIVVISGIFWLSQPVFGIEYGGIGGKPAYPRPDAPRSESIFIHNITPGQIINEGVNVINNTQETKVFKVYAADYTPSTDGGYACKQLSEKQTEVGTWINLEKDEVIVEPYRSELVPFIITVPGSVEVGEYNGCILIQEKKEKTNVKDGINLNFRTGIRIALTVPGDIIKKLRIDGFEISQKGNGDFILTPIVANEGNVSIDAQVSVITKNIQGKQIFEHGGEYSVIKGERSRWNFEFKPPITGGWFSSELTVIYKDQGSQEVRLTTDKISFFSWPKPIVLIPVVILVFIIIIGTIVWSVISKKKRKEMSLWVNHTIKANENIQNIAHKHQIPWKKLAKANKLSPPFTVTEGQIIKVPPTYD
jgi:hypothetical protein